MRLIALVFISFVVIQGCGSADEKKEDLVSDDVINLELREKSKNILQDRYQIGLDAIDESTFEDKQKLEYLKTSKKIIFFSGADGRIRRSSELTARLEQINKQQKKLVLNANFRGLALLLLSLKMLGVCYADRFDDALKKMSQAFNSDLSDWDLYDKLNDIYFWSAKYPK